MDKTEAEFGADALPTDCWLNSLPRWLALFPPERSPMPYSLLHMLVLFAILVMAMPATTLSAEALPAPRIDSVVMAPRQPQTQSQATIWYDDFDQGYKRYAESTGGRTTRGAFGGKGECMACFYKKGTKGKGDRKVFFGDVGTSRGKAVRKDEQFTEVYTRWYVKHQHGWIGGSPAKMARLTSLVNGKWAQMMIAHVWGAGKGRLTLDPVRGVKNGQIATRKYNDWNGFKWLGNKPVSSYPISSTEEAGYWVCVEMRTKLNTPGKADGINQLWIDGRLECERLKMDFRGTYTKHGLNAFFLETYWNKNSPVDQYRYFDNLVISTKPIGPVTAPLNPVLLRTPFHGPGKLADWEVELASDFEGKDKVFTAKGLKTALKVTIDKTSGAFSGSLAGKTALENGKTYYARVRQQNDSNVWSPWSRWHQGFRVE